MTRRAGLRAALTTALALAARVEDKPILTAGDHDALVGLGEDFRIAVAREAATAAKWRGIVSDEADADIDAAVEAVHTIATVIISTPATTRHGIKVKARAIAWSFGGETMQDDPGVGALMSLIRDVESLLQKINVAHQARADPSSRS